MAYSLTRSQLSTVRHRIIDTYRRATPDQVARGHAWYSAAHDFALELDPSNLERAAGVIAALSPRLSWELNMRQAKRAYLLGEATGGLGNSCRSATRILNGEHWTEVLRGPKVRAFAASIIDPHDSGAVVIDRHALSIALGRQVGEKRTVTHPGPQGGPRGLRRRLPLGRPARGRDCHHHPGHDLAGLARAHRLTTGPRCA